MKITIASDAERFCSELRREIGVLQNELSEIPALLAQAKKAADVSEIKRLKARESEFHELLLTAAADAQRKLKQFSSTQNDAEFAKQADEDLELSSSARDALRQTVECMVREADEAVHAAEAIVNTTYSEIGQSRQMQVALQQELSALIAETSEKLVA